MGPTSVPGGPSDTPAPAPTLTTLNGWPLPTRNMKGMAAASVEPCCSETMPEYSLAAGTEPERVTVSVAEAPAARERLEGDTAMPETAELVPLTVQHVE